MSTARGARGALRPFERRVRQLTSEGGGCRSLEEGQRVEFDVAPGRKREEAKNVRVI